MRRRKFELVHTTCRKCGIPLVTGSCSILGVDALKARLDRICSDCITEEERQEIIHGQAVAILSSYHQSQS